METRAVRRFSLRETRPTVNRSQIATVKTQSLTYLDLNGVWNRFLSLPSKQVNQHSSDTVRTNVCDELRSVIWQDCLFIAYASLADVNGWDTHASLWMLPRRMRGLLSRDSSLAIAPFGGRGLVALGTASATLAKTQLCVSLFLFLWNQRLAVYWSTNERSTLDLSI